MLMIQTLVLHGSPTKIAKASDKVRKGAGEKMTPESQKKQLIISLDKLLKKACNLIEKEKW